MGLEPQRNRGWRKHRLLAPLALAAVPALAASAFAAGHHGAGATSPPGGGPSGVVIDPLVHATVPDAVRVNSAGIKIRTKGPRDLLGTLITVAPGGTFGWHTHPGPVLVAIASGTLSLYEAHHHGCAKRRVGPGQAFIEDGGHVHLARNEGSEPVKVYATFLARTGTTDFLKPARDPGTCHV
jgi:quercetin dioxygenase-like cupin family protein